MILEIIAAKRPKLLATTSLNAGRSISHWLAGCFNKVSVSTSKYVVISVETDAVEAHESAKVFKADKAFKAVEPLDHVRL